MCPIFTRSSFFFKPRINNKSLRLQKNTFETLYHIKVGQLETVYPIKKMCVSHYNCHCVPLKKDFLLPKSAVIYLLSS